MYQPLQLSYILRTNKQRKDGSVPIYLRIRVNGSVSELSIGRTVDAEKWNSDKQKVRGSGMKYKSLNSYLDIVKAKVVEAHGELLREEKDKITAKAVKNRLTGKDKTKEKHPILKLFRDHNQKMESLIGKDYAKATYKKYRACLNHLEDFMEKKYRKDLPVSEVDLEFIEGFEHYLKTKKNSCSHNTALKYIALFKKIVRIAYKREWIERNPFDEYTISYNKKIPTLLTQDELSRIENKEFEIERICRVRDVFLFSCYTGLSFSDAEKIRQTHIKANGDGDQYLELSRTKTREHVAIPLLPRAQEIIDRYKDDPETMDGNLLPMISNQKTNAYLKEIADLCRINKHLTHHVARHTCATTVLLANGVPVETVQKILGHAQLDTTMHYARVTVEKLNKDMEDLRKKLEE